MQYALCRHIKANGLRCQAPSLTDNIWCYFHSRLHQTHKKFRHTDATRGYLIPGQHVELAAIEDRESVQVALSVVINALATGNLDTRRATALLYGLQLASHNVANINTKPYAPRIVRDVETSPEGLDLAQPGATVEINEDYDEKADFALDDEDEDEEENGDIYYRQAMLSPNNGRTSDPSPTEKVNESRSDRLTRSEPVRQDISS